MSTSTDSLEECLWPVDPHHFNSTPIKCAFKCRNPGYKTYINLHKHYLEVHKICLHRVARLDPNNEDEFRTQLTSFFAPFTGGRATSQGSRRYNPGGHTTSYPNQPPATFSMPQVAGPSHLGGLQTPGNTMFHSTAPSLGQNCPPNPPGLYTIPIPIGGPRQGHSPRSRPSVLGEVGRSRSPTIHPTTRHQPYPQFRPQRHGLYVNHSPVHGQVKGKGRELPLTAMDNGLLTPDTPSRGNCLEFPTPTTGLHRVTDAESSQHLNTDLRHPRPQQAATETLILTQRAPTPQFPTETMASGTFYRPATAQDVTSTRESKDPIQVNCTQPEQLQRQLQAILTGPWDPATFPPTPLTGTNTLPGGSPCRPQLNPPKCSPWRVNQNRRPEPSTPTTARIPSPHYTTQQPPSHPYSRPGNGSTTSQRARQARENRQQESAEELGAMRETLPHNGPPLEGGETRVVVDVPHPTHGHRCERNCTGNATSGLLEVQKKETAISLTDRRNALSSSPTESTSTQIRPPSRCALSQPEERSPVCSALPRTIATPPQGRAKPRVPRRVNGERRLDGLSATWKEPALPQLRGGVPAQTQFAPGVPGPVERPQTTGEHTPPVLSVQAPCQKSVPIQRRNMDERHLTTVADKETSHKDGYGQDPFPDISWEGWGLIKTPDGVYLPEAFNLFPHELEDLTDHWELSEG